MLDKLGFLLTPLRNLSGFTDRSMKIYERLLLKRSLDFERELKVIDLLYHKPEKVLFRKENPDLRTVQDGDLITVKVVVDDYKIPYKNYQPHKILCHNQTGFITVVYFKMLDYMKPMFKEGNEIVISGKVEKFNNELQMTHPDYVNNQNIPNYEQIYPLTAGLINKNLRQNIQKILQKIPDLPEWLPNDLLFENGWKSWKESILSMHNAKNDNELLDNSPYIERLAFDELLANQISFNLVKEKIKLENQKDIFANKNNSLKKYFLELLPFELTNDQKKVIKEIEDDLYSQKRMLRLVQGDVGSGKTVVAFLSMLPFLENHKQIAFMVPTSILATQHFEWLKNICTKSNNIEIIDYNELASSKKNLENSLLYFDKNEKNIKIKIALLTGKIKGKKREKILNALKNGEIDILIGTHAIFQENVEFKNLEYVVIDEQHKFGVAQRLNLIEKGKNTDTLIMTATPIPRTLALTIYGDMDISTIKEKPKNRKEIITTSLQKERFNDLIARIKEKIKENEKIYWICPLIDESENLPATPVFQRYEEFKKFFKEEELGLLHGKMAEEEKDKIMADFSDKNGLTKILVSTTVVEVGVDVPDATIIIIESPERFGLSQIHQLRGRVGRGDKQSYCILFYEKLTNSLKKRMEILKNSSDGFYIAEEDLKLRGSGEMLGVKQSGYQEYLIANLSSHYTLLLQASKIAKQIVKDKSLLNSESIKILLKMFNYDETFNRDIFN